MKLLYLKRIIKKKLDMMLYKYQVDLFIRIDQNLIKYGNKFKFYLIKLILAK